MIKGENLENFLKNDFIFIKNINDGLNRYSNICFSGEYYNIKNFILYIIDESNSCYFDFYFINLNKDDKQNFLEKINYDKIINKFDFNNSEIYFNSKNIEKEILKFIIKISIEEILFSTFYFKNPDITIWTNYNNQIILFFKNKDEFFKYKNIAINNNLNLVFEKE